ncbi:Stp1/IreP family PP2C-type Ser/Thr phosphatase [Bombilactobacillus bombi]|uniref:Stp1/IreP family PP2C-type Ser/Thr phosphatase n=1 Tax=Bombilactobacillus bombi TaxID=1303590 RepID=UPI000E58C33D|nr:Stp1/IreP family PP2C-type Ser/Thr phosphatase [Bombilactobacillus bombi]AXX64342.1 Stp1/IreP family PP2C-type Ser/Thr phosphatase [Bombilactobacillus bombi]
MDIAFKTDIGKKRQTNQDYVQVYRNQANVVFAVVADGMGGHRGGDVASDMVVNHFGTEFQKNTSRDIKEVSHWANDILALENKRVIALSNQDSELTGMGTTIVGAFVFPKQLVVFNVGDSRCYLLRDGKLQQLSFDHSLVNELLISGAITEQEAKHHPNKNIITQSLGVSPDVSPTFGTFDLQTSDQLLLCSDGLSNMVDDEQLEQVLQKKLTAQQKCDLLIQMANDAGGSDNITALVVDMQGNSEVVAHD